VDYAGHFQQEAAAFEAAARQAAGAEAAPAVPSCPGWVLTDLVLHLGIVHRLVARIIGERMQQPPAMGGDRSWLSLAEEWGGWLPPGRAPEGTARPLDAALAADAVGQTFEVMAPMRRAVAKAPRGQGERFLFRRTDGPQTWAVRFDGESVRLDAPGEPHDIQISGTASDLALFLWQRKVADRLEVQGDTSLLSGYFVLVPPL